MESLNSTDSPDIQFEKETFARRSAIAVVRECFPQSCSKRIWIVMS